MKLNFKSYYQDIDLVLKNSLLKINDNDKCVCQYVCTPLYMHHVWDFNLKVCGFVDVEIRLIKHDLNQ